MEDERTDMEILRHLEEDGRLVIIHVDVAAETSPDLEAPLTDADVASAMADYFGTRKHYPYNRKGTDIVATKVGNHLHNLRLTRDMTGRPCVGGDLGRTRFFDTSVA